MTGEAFTPNFAGKTSPHIVKVVCMSDNVNGVDTVSAIRVLSAAEAAAAPLSTSRRPGAGRPSPRLTAIRGLEVGGRVEFACPPDRDIKAFRNTISSSLYRKDAINFPVSVQIVNGNTVAVTRRAVEVVAEAPTEAPSAPVADAPVEGQ
jgi:hypothetical protein